MPANGRTAMSAAIRVGMSVTKGIAVHARGAPATIVAVGAAAAVVGFGTAVAYAAYEMAKAPAARRGLEARRGAARLMAR